MYDSKNNVEEALSFERRLISTINIITLFCILVLYCTLIIRGCLYLSVLDPTCSIHRIGAINGSMDRVDVCRGTTPATRITDTWPMLSTSSSSQAQRLPILLEFTDTCLSILVAPFICILAGQKEQYEQQHVSCTNEYEIRSSFAPINIVLYSSYHVRERSFAGCCDSDETRRASGVLNPMRDTISPRRVPEGDGMTTNRPLDLRTDYLISLFIFCPILLSY